METVPVDAMRDDIDGGKFAPAPFLTQPGKSAFNLFPGKLRVDDDPVGVFERRRILFFRDLAVHRDATDDLQPIPIRPKNSQIMAEVPDVLENENNRGIDLFNQSLRLESRENIAAFQIGRMNCQTAIADRFAGVADAQIVNLVTIREPRHDAVHHPRQTVALRVEADGNEFDAGTEDSSAWFVSGAAARVAKNNPRPSGEPFGLFSLRQVTVNPALLR